MLQKSGILHTVAWRHHLWNFAQPVALLGVAMLTALYSSSAANQGRVVIAVVSALASLAMALWVSLRFLPRLARGVDWSWIPFTSRYRVTRDGWIYLCAIGIVIFAAVNTSNNLLYMVLAGMLAVLLLSGFLAALNFRYMAMELRLPARCFARQTFPFTVRIQNMRRIFPAFSLYAGPEPDSPLRFKPLYFVLTRAGASVERSGKTSFERRGVYQIRSMEAVSRYPFGFFSKGRERNVRADCVCYPELLPQEQLDFSAVDRRGTNSRFDRGPGYDLYTVRDYVPSDSARHVHWKASAKTAVLKTREFALEDSPATVLAFDRFGGGGDGERFEQLVSYTASLVYYLAQDGRSVRLVSDDFETPHDSAASPEASMDSILNYLAGVQMSPSAPPPGRGLHPGAVLLSLRHGYEPPR